MTLQPTSPPKKRRRGKRSSTALPVLLIGCFLTLSITFFHGSIVHNLSDNTHVLESLLMDDTKASSITTPTKTEDGSATTKLARIAPSLAGLSCDTYGGPKDAAEMVYWSDLEEDSTHMSPFYDPEKYMTFEPDGGGWNNIRMSMETVLAMAHAMGRTLVLPPEQRMYLLHGNDQRREFSFQDFFPMEQIAKEHAGLDIITMEEFLEKVAMAGKITDATGKVSFPPHNRTNWNGMSREINQELSPWLRSITHMPEWNPQECLAAFPSSSSNADVEAMQELHNMLQTEKNLPKYQDYIGHPVAIDASPKDRLLENLAGRDKLCIYDQTLQQAPVLHFHGNAKMGGRLLVHFYAFLFFENWKEDLWMKRFVRDHVRYVDEIQCAAARIIEAVRQRSLQRGNGGVFDAFHVRRGDFQYKVTRVEASEIYNISCDVIPENSTVYIGTDERDKSFFNDLKKHYDVVFLDDYLHLVEGMNPSYFGMLDQMVLSRSRYFFGCWFSTFTSYVNRLRGYHSQLQKEEGYEQGVIQSYYYVLPKDKLAMREFWPVKKAFHAREFPRSWLNLDADVDK